MADQKLKVTASVTQHLPHGQTQESKDLLKDLGRTFKKTDQKLRKQQIALFPSLQRKDCP